MTDDVEPKRPRRGPGDVGLALLNSAMSPYLALRKIGNHSMFKVHNREQFAVNNSCFINKFNRIYTCNYLAVSRWFSRSKIIQKFISHI